MVKHAASFFFSPKRDAFKIKSDTMLILVRSLFQNLFELTGQLRKGGLMMIKGQPCKISDVSHSKTGKHGSAKCNFSAYNIFNNKKLEDMMPSSQGTTVPVVARTEYTLVDISEEDYLTLMTDSGETREDLKLPDYPENYAHELRTAFDEGKQLILTVLAACGH